MFLNKSFPYTDSYRNHGIISTLLGVLVVFILIFLQPFGSGNSTLPYKNIYFSGYGLITLITYLLLFTLSKIYYRIFQLWKWLEELVFSVVFISLSITIAFFYTEAFINKAPERLILSHFLGWFQMIFLGFSPILLSVTILLRKYFGETAIEKSSISQNTEKHKEKNKIKILSSLKKEFLLVAIEDIVYVRSEDNYVFIYFFEETLLKEKLLRSTLVKINEQLPSFVKSHRSYLINPNYIASLKGNAQNADLQLKNLSVNIPVSKTCFESIKNLGSNPEV